jgi:hypothetical protein
VPTTLINTLMAKKKNTLWDSFTSEKWNKLNKDRVVQNLIFFTFPFNFPNGGSRELEIISL